MRTRFKLDWCALVDPCSWLYPHGLERGLLAMSYLVRTASDHQEYGISGPVDLLCCKPTCVNHQQVDNIWSLADLRCRFQYAILHRGNERVQRWRTENAIGFNETATITGHHFKPMAPGAGFLCEAYAEKSFSELLAVTDVWINRWLNPCHKRGARWVRRASLCFDHKGTMRFDLEYGYRRDSSRWFHTLAMQERREPPYAVLRRAIDALGELTAKAVSR